MRHFTKCLVLTAVLTGCESGTEPADPHISRPKPPDTAVA
jgi:hypothetical protein